MGYGIFRLDISPRRLSIKSQPQRGDHQSPEFQGLFISKDSQGTIEYNQNGVIKAKTSRISTSS
jgi:hypothetical protein